VTLQKDEITGRDEQEWRKDTAEKYKAISKVST
jgi:hypothetical protein